MRNRILMAAAAGTMGALTGVAAWLLPRSRRRMTPAERERRRRLAVNQRGRVGSATVVDFRDGILCYSYWVGGVEYMASQDLTGLSGFLPEDAATTIELPATIKFLADNPANSIVMCEEWNGLRFRQARENAATEPQPSR